MDVATTPVASINHTEASTGIQNRYSHYQRGLTIVEVIISLAITGVLFSVALPNLHSVLAQNRLVGELNNLSTALALARTEAIKRHHPVVLCKSGDASNCYKGGDWEDGWIVYSDQNRNHQREEDEELIWVGPRFNSGNSLSFRAFGSKNYVMYKPDGSVFNNGSFTLCTPSHPEFARTLIINRQGRVRVGISLPEDEPITCE